jgi:hypothetical protein
MVSKMNKADLYKAYKALEQSHMKIEMELNDMKENMEGGIEITKEMISHLKEENEKLLEEHEKLLEENHKLKWKISEDNESLNRALERYKKLMITLKENRELKKENEKLKKTLVRWQEKADFNLSDSDDESNPPCVTCGGCHGRFVDGESYCDDWDCVNSDDEEVSFCGVNGHRCEECTDCARSKVCDTCKCVGGCYEDCLSNS